MHIPGQAAVNYIVNVVSPVSGPRRFGVTLANTFWTGPFQVGTALQNGTPVGHFTFFGGPVEIMTFTLLGNEVYLFQNGVGTCANANGDQGSCELIRQ